MCRGASGASILLWANGHVPLGEDGSTSDTSVADRAHCEDHWLSAALHVWRMGDICASEGAPAKVDCPAQALPVAGLTMLMHLCVQTASAPEILTSLKSN